jgi:hypothetical protein
MSALDFMRGVPVPELLPFRNLNISPAPVPPMLRLPDELLEQIAIYVVSKAEVQVMEGTGFLAVRQHRRTIMTYIGGLSDVSKRLFQDQADARSLILTCRRFRRIAEPMIYEHISLPQHVSNIYLPYARSALPNLVRTLITRPDLAWRTRTLDLWMQDRSLSLNPRYTPNLPIPNPYQEAFQMAAALIARRRRDFGDDIVHWANELRDYQEIAMHAVLILLLRNLRNLKLYAPLSKSTMFRFDHADPRNRPDTDAKNYLALDLALQESGIESVYLGIPFHIIGFPAMFLTTMEIDVLFLGDWDYNWVEMGRGQFPIVFRNVKNLTIVLNPFIFSGVRLMPWFRLQHPRIALYHFVQNMVPNTENFCITAPRGSIQFDETKSVKRDRWGDLFPANLVPSQQPIDLEYSPLTGSRWDNHWDWFLIPIKVLKDKLKSLQLPMNWYSSTGLRTQPMPHLKKFQRLEVVVLPRVAIIANPHGKRYRPERHERHPIEFLPRSVKKLVISNVDVETCAWVQAAFQVKWFFPDLQTVELIFQDNFQPVLSYGFESDATQAGVKVIARWNGMQTTL